MKTADELFDGSNAHLLDDSAVDPLVIPSPVDKAVSRHKQGIGNSFYGEMEGIARRYEKALTTIMSGGITGCNSELRDIAMLALQIENDGVFAIGRNAGIESAAQLIEQQKYPIYDSEYLAETIRTLKQPKG